MRNMINFAENSESILLIFFFCSVSLNIETFKRSQIPGETKRETELLLDLQVEE